MQLCSQPDAVDGLAQLGLAAPALLWSEVTSSISKHVWRRELRASDAASLLDVFLGLGLTRVATNEMYLRAADVARQLGWAKSYDAEYVALAQMLDVPLVTLDAKLKRGAGHLVTVLTPDEVL